MAAFSAGMGGLQADISPGSVITKGRMPVRKLGKTGEKVSILGYGGGSQFMLMPDGVWEPHLEYAIQSGINYFDTASNYGEDQKVTSEMRFGQILPPHRKKIILLTKIHERDTEKAKIEFERSLNRLKTGYVDILLIHAITADDQVTDIKKGVYAYLLDLKKQGVAKYIGFSSMDSAERSKELIEELDFDVTLLAMNPANYNNFVDVALPAARKKEMGVIAMKIMRNIVNQHGSPKELMEYTWNLPGVSCNLVSHNGLEPLKQNIELAMGYMPGQGSETGRKEIEKRFSQLDGKTLFDWARPGYRDGMNG
jgi:hypothetical protein